MFQLLAAKLKWDHHLAEVAADQWDHHLAVAEAEAQEPLELQEAQEETVETVCRVQFLEAQRIMAAAAEVEAATVAVADLVKYLSK